MCSLPIRIYDDFIHHCIYQGGDMKSHLKSDQIHDEGAKTSDSGSHHGLQTQQVDQLLSICSYSLFMLP